MAMALAIALWFFAVNRYTREITEVIDLEVAIPAGFTILNQSTRNVSISLKGPQRHVDQISRFIIEKKIKARYELSVNTEERDDPIKRSIVLSKDNLNLPYDVRVESIYPERVEIELSRLEKKYLNVRIQKTGQVAPGFEIKNEFVYPGTVEVTGPSNLVRRVSEIGTVPIDITGITTDKNRTFPWVIDIEQDVKMIDNDKTVLIPIRCDEQVRVWFTISELQDIKRLEKIRINILQPPALPYKVTLQDEFISLSVKGPKLVIDKLTPADVTAYVNVGSLIPPGPYNQPVQLNLPKGVEVEGQIPEIHVDLQELEGKKD